MKTWILLVAFLSVVGGPLSAAAQNTAEDVFQATVISVISLEQEILPGTETSSFVQYLEAQITNGVRNGERIEVFNNYVPLSSGDRFIAAQSLDPSGVPTYFLQDVDRRTPVVVIALLFAIAVIATTGMIGLRSLLALGMSFAAIFFVLVPLLIAGYPPIPTTILVAAIIFACGMYGTHGVNRVTHAAFLGTIATVALSGVGAEIVLMFAKISGFAADEAVALNASMAGTLNLPGLLLSGIIIGAMGLLDDIAITQASMVGQFRKTAPHLSPRELYEKVMHVGREHIAALVNTLALAYAGVSLPLLLLASRTDLPLWMYINQEVFATEIIRTAVGGIALVLAVPLTSLIAIRLITPETIDTIEHHGHTH